MYCILIFLKVTDNDDYVCQSALTMTADPVFAFSLCLVESANFLKNKFQTASFIVIISTFDKTHIHAKQLHPIIR
ncbi:hypothetical protein T08_15449 [Trichinella sp. T8]|nr:hypothetical protein T08_15449 [Trichinella sp. T8]